MRISMLTVSVWQRSFIAWLNISINISTSKMSVTWDFRCFFSTRNSLDRRSFQHFEWKLIEPCFIFVGANTKLEQEVFFTRRLEVDYRSRLNEISLTVIMQIAIGGLQYSDWIESVNQLLRQNQKQLKTT